MNKYLSVFILQFLLTNFAYSQSFQDSLQHIIQYLDSIDTKVNYDSTTTKVLTQLDFQITKYKGTRNYKLSKTTISAMGIAMSKDLRKIFFDNGSLVLNYDYSFGYYCYNCNIKEPEYVSFGDNKSCYLKFSFDTNLKRFIIDEQSCNKQIQAIMIDNKQDYSFNYLIQPFAKEMKQKLLNVDTKLDDKKSIIYFVLH